MSVKALSAHAATEPDQLTAALAAVSDQPVLGAVTVRALTEVSLVEHTVHLLDLNVAVGGDIPARDVIIGARDIVVDIADPAELLEAATGRRDRGLLPLMR
jgi:hypothetical protein